MNNLYTLKITIAATSLYFFFQQEFPNFQVDVYATVLDNGGSALAAAIMAASLALANAGVPMFGLVTASTVVCRLLLKF